MIKLYINSYTISFISESYRSDLEQTKKKNIEALGKGNLRNLIEVEPGLETLRKK